jgi:non-specific protein-tyrosine kinase
MPTLRQIESSLTESFQLLQTNLTFAGIQDLENKGRSLLVTSSSTGEGKTLTLLNLAMAIRQMGKSVIVVDTDLRQPSLHYFFSQPNTRGLTTALKEPEETFNVAHHLMPTGIDNLLVMPTGPAPVNIAGLLSSARLGGIISELKLLADVVVLDSPPALAYMDASLLSMACDGTLLVVRAGYSRADTLKRTRDQFRQSKATLLGFVLNMAPVPPRNTPERYQIFNRPNLLTRLIKKGFSNS